MKTTIDIADSLLEETKKLAAREQTTVRALVESGLRHVLSQKRPQSQRFRLRNASFKGKGLTPSAKGANWERLRELAYEGRGG